MLTLGGKFKQTSQPQYNIAKLEDKDLLVLYCVYPEWGYQRVTRILDMTGSLSLLNCHANSIELLS